MMVDKKTVVLFLLATVLIGFFLVSSYSFSSLVTDSGFDTSYDSGGGGSSGGGGFGGGSSYDHDYHSSSSGGIIDTIIIVLFILAYIVYVIMTLVDYYKKSKLLFSVTLFIVLFTVVIFVIDVGMGLLAGIFFFIIFKCVKVILSKSKVPSYYNERAFRVYSKEKRNKPPLTEENEQILKNSYQIYLNIQEAWMNFDYSTLRTLVTDELFNTYQNQLQTLELKGQKNIMHDFIFISSELLKIEKEKEISTILVELEVEFYDYIVDNKNKKVRGSKRNKVVMDYLLTFVSSEMEEKCPHCGAQLEKGTTTCGYCHTQIQSVMKSMKLSKKEVLSQKMK